MDRLLRIKNSWQLKLSDVLIVLIFLCYFSSSSAKTLFVDSESPPPGFEAVSVTQHLRVSVYFLHENMGYFYVNIRKGRLKFQSPEQLISHLKAVRNSKKLSDLLNNSFQLNIECLSNGVAELSEDCKQLKKNEAYIIYDPQHEIVYLFLSSSHLQRPDLAHTIDFLPDSTASWSYMNKLGAAGSFSSDKTVFRSSIYPSTPDYYNLYSNNIFAYGNNSLIGNISQNNGIDNGQHFQIQSLYAQNISRDKIYTGGYIVNPSSPFFQTQILAGVGVKTTLETLRNSESITASPLVIFVPQASQVSIFKNEQLIYSQYLPAGYQTINTNGFPDGGYELTIKVGVNNTTQRFFSKGFSLPPPQAPQYYVTAGYLTNGLTLDNNGYNFLPDVLNVPVVQAGFSSRLNQRLAIMGDVLLNSHQGLFDFGPAFFIGNSFVKTTGLLTTKSNYGLYTLINTQRKQLNLSVIATKIFYQDKNEDYYFLNNLEDNNSASLSYQLTQKDLIGMQANYTKLLEQPRSYGAGAYYQRQIGFYKGMGFFLNTAYNEAVHIGNTYYFGLSMNFSRGRLAGTESLSWQNQQNNNQNNPLAMPVVAQGSTVYSHQNERGLGYSLNEMHTVSRTASSFAGIYNYTAANEFISSYINYNQTREDGSSIAYGGSLETEIAANENGVFLNGADRGNSAGIIAQVTSANLNDKSAQFALIDAYNRKVAVIPVNEKVFVPLPGYTDENFTLVNLSSADYAIQEPMRHVTLYPGNIDHYTWQVERRIIVIGRLLNRDKSQPLRNRWIHSGQNGIFSDEEGYFQLELSQNISSLSVEGLGNCQIDLPNFQGNKAYYYLENVSCL
ncbi:TcfC E-set like domain-containing protein [Legionella quinlivanii]|uniref:TcfC E-set like domain-containing protein n=1 Tax=Legionella quinlivanii TaxID=45073 RepID=UPI002242F7FA|nr:TcfC E-set like domain-containing protein [Legionella quinlivanii]MCW8449732.1 TcfC E-set like domain-containing protein [Legionella quinlivanii]